MSGTQISGRGFPRRFKYLVAPTSQRHTAVAVPDRSRQPFINAVPFSGATRGPHSTKPHPSYVRGVRRRWRIGSRESVSYPLQMQGNDGQWCGVKNIHPSSSSIDLAQDGVALGLSAECADLVSDLDSTPARRGDAEKYLSVSGGGSAYLRYGRADRGADRGALLLGHSRNELPFLVRHVDDAALLCTHAVHGTRATVHAQ